MSSDKSDGLKVREKLAVKLLLVAVKIIQPWQYEHQFTELLKSIEDTMNEKVE